MKEAKISIIKKSSEYAIFNQKSAVKGQFHIDKASRKCSALLKVQNLKRNTSKYPYQDFYSIFSCPNLEFIKEIEREIYEIIDLLNY